MFVGNSTRVAGALLVLCLAALGLLSTTADAQQRFDFDTTPGRLSKDIRPTHYQLSFDLDPARRGFSGRAAIRLQVRRPVDAVVVHAHDLKASRLTLASGSGRRPLHLSADPKQSTWRLAPADGMPIGAGEHTLEIAYSGTVQRTGEGLYLAPYRVRGKPARMLATQLESVHARSLFPGFDEPAFRAAFEIVVRAPTGLEVVSNMPLASRTAHGARGSVHRFLPTPPMPTYLVALAVGRFDALAGEVDGVPLRILGAEGKREQAAYAMSVTRDVLPFYREYFGVPYALPKLDQLAVPSVRGGAMEDWGLISYNEAVLLFDPARSSPATQRWVFAIVAHEIAHQWFGNLVTAASWEEIWLNEAFATWMEGKASERLNPDWQVRLHQRPYLDRTMLRDAGSATRAIRSGAVEEDRVFDVFDNITYSKGGAVLSMLEQWLGAEVFRRGLAAYMQERRFSNATAGDLWHHMAAASGTEVAAVAASWTDQPGFPLVQVQVQAGCRDGRTVVRLAQRRFSLVGELPAQQWRIPVRLARGEQQATVLLAGPEQTVELDGCGSGSSSNSNGSNGSNDLPVVANADGRGFYRVEYAPDALQALTERFERLGAADRVTLLSDSFALAQAGRVPMAAYFRLLAALPRVADASRAALFTLAAADLAFLDRALAGTPDQPALQAAARTLLAPELTRLGWTARSDDDAQAAKLRGTLIRQLARFDDDGVVQRARELFDLDEARRAPLPAPIRAAVIDAVGRHADAARFKRLQARLDGAGGEEDRWLYVEALAAGRDRGRAERLLAGSLAGRLPPNIASSIPGLIGEHSPFADIAYRYTVDHWPALARLAGTGPSGGSATLLPSAAETLVDDASAIRLLDDQRRVIGDVGAAAAASVAARIRLHAAVRQREAGTLGSQLQGWQPAR